jgi:hypothetical protein
VPAYGHGQYSSFCEAHGKEAKARRDGWLAKRRTNPERNAIYGAQWTKFKAWLISNGNVICQRLEENGTRCTNPVEIRHHIFDPMQYPQFRYDPRYVVGVCREHHDDSPGEKFTDEESLRRKFAPTKIKIPTFG